MFVRKLAYCPEFLNLVDNSAYLYMFGGLSQILYVVCERFQDFSVDEVLYHTDALQDALRFSVGYAGDCDVYSCVVYHSGLVYITDGSTAYVSLHEQVFEDHVFDPVFLDAVYAYEKASRIMDSFAVTHNECACFSLVLLLALVTGSYYPPEMFGDRLLFRDRFGVSEGFCEVAYGFGVKVFTELLEAFDASRIVHLLDESYVLAVELESFSMYPFADGVAPLPTRHICVLFRTVDGRYGLADTEGVRQISSGDIERMGSVNCHIPRFVPWCDGCMIVGVRLGFGGIHMSYYSKSELVGKALSVEVEMAINAVNGECVLTSDADLTARNVWSDVMTIDLCDANARRKMFGFCSEHWDLLTNVDNYLHVKPYGNELDMDVCDFKAQPEASFHRGKDITPIETGHLSDVGPSSFDFGF